MPLLAAAGLAAPAQATTTTASITQLTLAKASGTRYPTNPNVTAILASESATAMEGHPRSHPQIAPHPTAGTMPNWLKDILLAAGLLAAIARRRRQTAKRLTDKTPRSRADTRERDPAREATARARIVFANYDRLIITYSGKEDTIYVLTPPGEEPRAILRAARLILPEHRYQDLADHLGVPSALPFE